MPFRFATTPHISAAAVGGRSAPPGASPGSVSPSSARPRRESHTASIAAIMSGLPVSARARMPVEECPAHRRRFRVAPGPGLMPFRFAISTPHISVIAAPAGVVGGRGAELPRRPVPVAVSRPPASNSFFSSGDRGQTSFSPDRTASLARALQPMMRRRPESHTASMALSADSAIISCLPVRTSSSRHSRGGRCRLSSTRTASTLSARHARIDQPRVGATTSKYPTGTKSRTPPEQGEPPFRRHDVLALRRQEPLLLQPGSQMISARVAGVPIPFASFSRSRKASSSTKRQAFCIASISVPSP